MRTLKAGALYFALVFGAGFVLGVPRVLWLAPELGARTAELIESPIMLVVIFFPAGGSSRTAGEQVPDPTAGAS